MCAPLGGNLTVCVCVCERWQDIEVHAGMHRAASHLVEALVELPVRPI